MDVRSWCLFGSRFVLVVAGLASVACTPLLAQPAPDWRQAAFHAVRNRRDFFVVARPRCPTDFRHASPPSFRFEKRGADFQWVEHVPAEGTWRTARLGSVWVFHHSVDPDYRGRIVVAEADPARGVQASTLHVSLHGAGRRTRPVRHRFCAELLLRLQDDDAELRRLLFFAFGYSFDKLDYEMQIAVCEAAFRSPTPECAALLSRVAGRVFPIYCTGCLIDTHRIQTPDGSRCSLKQSMLIQQTLEEIREELDRERQALSAAVKPDETKSAVKRYVSRQRPRYRSMFRPLVAPGWLEWAVREETEERSRYRVFMDRYNPDYSYSPWVHTDMDWFNHPSRRGLHLKLDNVVSAGRDGLAYINVALAAHPGTRNGCGWTDGFRVIGPVYGDVSAVDVNRVEGVEWKAEQRPGDELTFCARVGAGTTGTVVLVRDLGTSKDGTRITERFVVRLDRRKEAAAERALLQFALRYVDHEDALIRHLAGRAIFESSAPAVHSERRKATGDRRAFLERWCPGASRREWWWLELWAESAGWTLADTNRIFTLGTDLVERVERERKRSGTTSKEQDRDKRKPMFAGDQVTLASRLGEFLPEDEAKKVADKIFSIAFWPGQR